MYLQPAARCQCTTNTHTSVSTQANDGQTHEALPLLHMQQANACGWRMTARKALEGLRTMRDLPRRSGGKNSANKSNGTAKPPTPTPTKNLAIKKTTNDGATQLTTPAPSMTTILATKVGRRPTWSDM